MQRLQVRKGRERLSSRFEHVMQMLVVVSIVWVGAGWLEFLVVGWRRGLGIFGTGWGCGRWRTTNLSAWTVGRRGNAGWVDGGDIQVAGVEMLLPESACLVIMASSLDSQLEVRDK